MTVEEVIREKMRAMGVPNTIAKSKAVGIVAEILGEERGLLDGAFRAERQQAGEVMLEKERIIEEAKKNASEESERIIGEAIRERENIQAEIAKLEKEKERCNDYFEQLKKYKSIRDKAVEKLPEEHRNRVVMAEIFGMIVGSRIGADERIAYINGVAKILSGCKES